MILGLIKSFKQYVHEWSKPEPLKKCEIVIDMSDEVLEESFKHLKESVDIEHGSMKYDPKVGAICMFELAAMALAVNAEESIHTICGLRNKETGEIYGDYRVCISKVNAVQLAPQEVEG
jgi:hypothetical protein